MGFTLRTQGWFNIEKSINKIYHINSLKKKNHMIITYIEAEKTSEKIQYPCMTKTLIKVGMKGNFIN